MKTVKPACLFIFHSTVRPWKSHHEKPTHINNACVWSCVHSDAYLIVCLWHCMCYVSLCVWREPTVSRLSDYLNNLSLLSFLSLNPRWGCSSGTQQDKSASGASFPVIYGTPLWLWWSTTLQVSVPHEMLEFHTYIYFIYLLAFIHL